jgi:predicted nucleic acid-binding Zn ribbon protein
MPRPALTSIGAILDPLIRSLGLEGAWTEYRLQSEWTGIVGETIAAHTQPQRLRFNKLTVLVDSPVWMQQLSFLKPELIRKVNRAMGRTLVQELVLRPGRVDSPAERG